MEVNRYKGSLTVEQLIVAHEKIKANANSLYKEAQLLFENEMYARCHFLLCIANEELGKSIFVVSAAVDLVAENIDWHKFWKKLRNHKRKTEMIEFIENAFLSSDYNFTPWKEIEEKIPIFEELKMASLYADMFQNDFFNPEEIITFDLVKSALELTRHRIGFINAISPSDSILRAVKKEDILTYRAKLKEMGMDAGSEECS